MAFVRSCTDKHLNYDHLSKAMADRLQCTVLGHPMKLSEPTAATHAAVTPLTLQACLHTIPMMRPDGCEWAYDQMDCYQKTTDKETFAELTHSWGGAKVAMVMTAMQQVGAYEQVNVDFVIESENKIIISPGPDSNAQIERLCSQYCHVLRLSGEAEGSLNFVYLQPYHPTRSRAPSRRLWNIRPTSRPVWHAGHRPLRAPRAECPNGSSATGADKPS